MEDKMQISLPLCIGQKVYVLNDIYAEDGKFPIPKMAQISRRIVENYIIVCDGNITYDITVSNPNNGSRYTYSGYVAKSKIFASRKEAMQFAKLASIDIINPKDEDL